MRGNYPQIFLQDKEKGHTIFVGDFDTVEGIHDCSSLPDDFLDTHPNVMTWSKILGN
jgi:hypothetical protein